jgi:hypothetical protein
MLSRTELTTWIESCVLGDLRTLLQGVDAYYASTSRTTRDGKPLGAANFLLVAGCCTAIDYFGFVFQGSKCDEANAKAFTDRFLSQVDSRYSEVGSLIWRCFRQGTIHRSRPKRIVLEGEPGRAVVTGAGTEEDDPHLGPAPNVAGDSFLVNGRRLLRDIELAFEHGFRDWILKDAPEEAVARANPQDLVIRQGDIQGRAQLECVRRWNLGSRSDDEQRYLI